MVFCLNRQFVSRYTNIRRIFFELSLEVNDRFLIFSKLPDEMIIIPIFISRSIIVSKNRKHRITS